jgi:hypothetical protein
MFRLSLTPHLPALRRSLMAMMMLGMAATPRAADAWEVRDDLRVFFFGNSLIHHLTDNDDTTVPHWLALMARHEGRDLALDGRWGFPRNMADDLPPHPNWSFAEVPTAWNPDRPFSSAAFDTIVMNPENYIQYDPADRPYPDAGPERATPLGATLTILDWTMQNADAPRFLIYEGWADLHPFTRNFPPNARQLARYHRHAQRDYAAWYDDYVAKLSAERPDAEIALIPVGRVMSQLLTREPLSAIPPDVLYSDLSPHGTATTYLLAAMITYAALYGSRPPEGFDDFEGIDPAFAAAYETTADAIAAALLTQDR